MSTVAKKAIEHGGKGEGAKCESSHASNVWPNELTELTGAGSKEPKVLQQALTFLISGQLSDVCSGQPCTSTVLSAGG